MNTDLFGKWDETFRIACNALSDTLVVEVRDRTAAALGSMGAVISGRKKGDTVIGRCQLPLSSLLAGAPVNGWFALDSGGGVKLGLKLVSSTPGSVPMSYAAAPLPVLTAPPGEFGRSAAGASASGRLRGLSGLLQCREEVTSGARVFSHTTLRPPRVHHSRSPLTPSP
jgi:hypothetical protein